MKYLNLLLTFLLLGMLGCTGDNLISVEAEGATETLTEPSTDVWLDVAQAVSLDRETVNTALASGDMVLQMGKITYYPDPEYNVMLNCFDGDGNLVPQVSLPLRFLVEGRMQHMGRVTGYFGGGSCLVNADFTLTVERKWRYIGEGGHSIWGTYTLTTQADGSWTSHDVVTGGIGKFAGATGMGRSVGRLDTPVVYSMGVVTAPKDVSSTGYLFETEPQYSTRTGEIACKDRRGNDTTTSGTRQIEGRGLSTYGWYDLFVTNERCIDDGDIVTFYGTWSHTNAQGDALHGIHTVVVGIDEPWPIILIVTGGGGRFKNATGWISGREYWDERRSAGEGVIFMPGVETTVPDDGGSEYIPGTDITEQLRNELNAGLDVQLPAGHFYVSESIIVEGYSGTIKGAGKDVTIIETAQGFKATTDPFPIFTPNDRFTEIITVYLPTGDVTFEAMTILVTGDAPAELHSNLWNRGVTTIHNVLGVIAVSPEAESDVTVTFKDLRIKGEDSNDPGAVRGKNMIFPMVVSGWVISGYSVDKPINAVIKNCQIENAGESAITYFIGNGGSGDIKDNEILNSYGGIDLRTDINWAEVTNNRFENITTVPIVRGGGVSSYCFKDNTRDGVLMTNDCP